MGTFVNPGFKMNLMGTFVNPAGRGVFKGMLRGLSPPDQ